MRIGFGRAEACAIGDVTNQVLKKSGIDPEQVEPNVVFRSLTVNELALQVVTGKLDATIVWDAIARGYEGRADIVPIPLATNVVSTVPVAVLTSSSQPSLAEQFQQFVISERGRAIFEKHGYTVDAPR